MKHPKYSILGSLKASFVEAKSVLLDKVITEHFIDNLYGPENFIVQIRISRKSSEEYMLLNLSGGDTPMYLRLSKDGAIELKDIISKLYGSDEELAAPVV